MNQDSSPLVWLIVFILEMYCLDIDGMQGLFLEKLFLITVLITELLSVYLNNFDFDDVKYIFNFFFFLHLDLMSFS